MRRLGALVVLAACASRARPGDAAAAPEVEVAIEGLADASERDLRFAARRELDDFHTRGRRPADLEDAAYAMELFLRGEGYAHAEASFRAEPPDGAIRRAIFTVVEGPRAVLDAISFPGASVLSEPELRAHFELERGALLRTAKAWFVLAHVESGAAGVEASYLRAGHLRVRVGPPRVSWSEDRARATVELPIEEGPRYTVAAMEVEGAPGEEEERRAREALLDRPYVVRRPHEVAAELRARLLDAGHQLAEVSARAEVDDASATVRVLLRAVPGPVHHVREVTFEGQGRTRRRFLRSRVPLRPGDVMRQDRIDAAVDDLYKSGVFRSVRVRAGEFQGEGDDATAALRVEVEELLSRSVSFEAGWGSYELARARVRYEDRNLLGLGRQLNTEIFGSLKALGALASVSDSYLLGPSNTLRVAAGIQRREEPSFTRTGTRFDVSVERRFRGPYVAAVSYSYDVQKATDVVGVLPGAEEGGFVATAGIGASLVRDTRDDRLLPTRGSTAEAGVFWSSPALGADLDFAEVRAAWTKHVPLSRRVVLATGFRFTTREILDDRSSLPIAQRLFLGGESSVRSFFEDELGPADAEGDPLGGLTAAEASVEVRVRVWRQLHGALFYDVGSVGEGSFDVPGPPGHAVGIGARYYLPVGPVRLDVAYNPGRLFAAGGRWALHFAFGFSF